MEVAKDRVIPQTPKVPPPPKAKASIPKTKDPPAPKPSKAAAGPKPPSYPPGARPAEPAHPARAPSAPSTPITRSTPITPITPITPSATITPTYTTWQLTYRPTRTDQPPQQPRPGNTAGRGWGKASSNDPRDTWACANGLASAATTSTIAWLAQPLANPPCAPFTSFAQSASNA